MNDHSQKVARFRPTEAQRFPADPLPKALDQARELYKVAQNIAIPIPAASKCWGFTEKSSGGPQTVSCLKAYGLLQDSGGSGPARRVKLSDDAIKIIRDPRDISPERDNLVRQAALRPPLHRQIMNHFQGSLPPSDEALKTYLIFDVGLRDGAVNDCMRVFADTMAFAKIGSSGIIPEVAEDNSRNGSNQIQVGTSVQWAPEGVLQSEIPRSVTGTSPDGRFVFVEESSTGLPIEEIQIVQRAPPTETAVATRLPLQTAQSVSPAIPQEASVSRASAPLAPLRVGMERASFPLKAGLAVIEMPAELSKEDFEDFEAWVQLVLRKAKRSMRPS
jgi:hypothetical protein